MQKILTLHDNIYLIFYFFLFFQRGKKSHSSILDVVSVLYKGCWSRDVPTFSLNYDFLLKVSFYLFLLLSLLCKYRCIKINLNYTYLEYIHWHILIVLKCSQISSNVMTFTLFVCGCSIFLHNWFNFFFYLSISAFHASLVQMEVESPMW